MLSGGMFKRDNSLARSENLPIRGVTLPELKMSYCPGSVIPYKYSKNQALCEYQTYMYLTY